MASGYCGNPDGAVHAGSQAIGLLCLLILAPPPTGAQDRAGLRAGLERTLRFLSADELRGRSAREPGAAKAAGFIAAEFESAGLKPLGEGFLDEFRIQVQRPDSESVVLDGRPQDAAEFFIRADIPEIEARSGRDTFEIRRMGATFDRSLLRGEGRRIVLIPKTHRDIFERYRSFFGGEQITLAEDRPDSGVIVGILSDSADAASYRILRRSSVAADTLANVAGIVPGRNREEFVLFSAHYDHLGVIRPAGGDSIANGANDNASGTAALIELARIFSPGPAPEHSLVFAAFAAEEIGGLGSTAFSKRYDPSAVTAMVNIEMVGTVSVFGPGAFWITGYEKSTFGALVSGALEGSSYSAHPDPYPDQNLFERSDNAVFARLGVPAHSVSTARIDIDSNYHAVSDEFETLDPANLAMIVEAIALATRGLADGTMTPSRIAPAEAPGGRR